MKVLVAGGTGAVGVPLVRRLLAHGDAVTGLTRSHTGAELLRGLGAEAVHADALDRDALLAAVDGHQFDAVIHEMTSLRKLPMRFSDMEDTNTLRRDGTRNLLEVARRVGATRVVTQSIVLGYGYTDHGAAPLTEEAPFGEDGDPRLAPALGAMKSAEDQVLEDPAVEGIVLRYGLFYGSDITANARRLRRRTLPVPARGGCLALVHHDDAAAATVAALHRGEPDTVYNIVDDTPVTWRRYVEEIAAVMDAPRPLALPDWLLRSVAPYAGVFLTRVNMVVSNGRAEKDLGWVPEYPSYRDGLAASAQRARQEAVRST